MGSPYSEPLELVGAEVISLLSEYSYQGSWIAYVKYNDEMGLVMGNYGSCSGCDNYQSIIRSNDPEKQLKKLGKTLLEGLIVIDDNSIIEDYLEAFKDCNNLKSFKDTFNEDYHNRFSHSNLTEELYE